MAYVQGVAPGHVDYAPVVRRIGVEDVRQALRQGIDDFVEKPSHYVFLCLVYPVMGLAIGFWTAGHNVLPLLFPMIAGFALVGPLAGVGLYEISRRRELGLDTSWVHALEVMRSPARPSILMLGALLLLIFFGWLFVAQALYFWLYQTMSVPGSYVQFIGDVLTTSRGWALILLGNIIGFVFALVTLSISVVSFPLLLDQHVGVATAMGTSVRVTGMNPGPVLLWGLIVAVALVLGSLPLFIGLPLVLPVLGHATWHLYRKAVESPHAAESGSSARRI